MKMKLINFLKAVIFASMMMLSIKSFPMILDGAGSSGGGQGVVYSNGQVRFLDFIHPNEMPSIATGKDDIYKFFWSEERYTKYAGQECNNFFSPAIEIFKTWSEEFPVLRLLVVELEKVRPIAVEFRLKNKLENMSPSISFNHQELLAEYDSNKVFISRRLINQISENDRIGLSVHEGLRHLNFQNLISEILTTKEVEVLTRHFMNMGFSEDDTLSACEKLKSRPERSPELLKINQIRQLKREVQHKRYDYKLSLQKRIYWEQEYLRLDQEEDLLILKLIESKVKKLEISAGYFESNIINTVLSTKLGLCKMFDTWKLEVVNRCW